MNKNPKNAVSQPCACVPFGTIELAKRYQKQSRQASRLGKLPVLAGHVNSARVTFDADAPCHLGLGTFDIQGELPMFAIRLQLGANMLYWLVNSADPELWSMVDAWRKAGRMAVAAEFDNGKMLFVDRDYRSGAAMSALRRQAESTNRQAATRDFMQCAGEALVSGQLASMATSDIPGIPSLRNVQGCTVRTQTTGRILVPLERAFSSSCDLLMPEPLTKYAPSGQAVH